MTPVYDLDLTVAEIFARLEPAGWWNAGDLDRMQHRHLRSRHRPRHPIHRRRLRAKETEQLRGEHRGGVGTGGGLTNLEFAA